MAGQDDVLHQTLRALHAHLHPEWGDRTGLDVFGRLLAKHVKPAGWTANTHLDVREVHMRPARRNGPSTHWHRFHVHTVGSCGLRVSNQSSLLTSKGNSGCSTAITASTRGRLGDRLGRTEFISTSCLETFAS